MTDGTPKTLKDAIANGLETAKTVGMMEDEAKDLSEEVSPHIMDFLAQKFGAAMMDNPDAEVVLKKLFDKIKE